MPSKREQFGAFGGRVQFELPNVTVNMTGGLEVFMTTSVIVAGARTPTGKLMGSLKDFSGTDLGGIAIAAALEKARVPASLVEYVIMGQVLTAGAGQMPAR